MDMGKYFFQKKLQFLVGIVKKCVNLRQVQVSFNQSCLSGAGRDAKTVNDMKKLFIYTLLAAAASMPVAAQTNIFNNPDNKAYFGVRVGGEVTCPGDVKTGGVGVGAFNNGGGIEFGGIYNIPVVANFYVEPGHKLYYNTYSFKKVWAQANDFDSATIKKFGMRIPVMAGYHFDFTDDIKVSVFTGPELEIGFSAKEQVKANGVKVSESVYGEDGGMKRVDLLWGIGAGITYQKYYFGVSGGIGMLNMIDMDDVTFHENRVTFTLGYNF